MAGRWPSDETLAHGENASHNPGLPGRNLAIWVCRVKGPPVRCLTASLARVPWLANPAGGASPRRPTAGCNRPAGGGQSGSRAARKSGCFPSAGHEPLKTSVVRDGRRTVGQAVPMRRGRSLSATICGDPGAATPRTLQYYDRVTIMAGHPADASGTPAGTAPGRMECSTTALKKSCPGKGRVKSACTQRPNTDVSVWRARTAHGGTVPVDGTPFPPNCQHPLPEPTGLLQALFSPAPVMEAR